jgi:hypothetical protein
MTGVLVWLGGWAFALSLLLTPIVRDIFSSYGVMDRPDSARKVHRKPIPRVGGIAVAISYFGSFWLVSRYPGGLESRQVSLVWALLPSALVIFAIGLIDDFLGLKPWEKLAGQSGAAALAYWSGIRMMTIDGYATGWWNAPVTLLWLLACTNAFNLVDGLDGLAAGVGFFATLTTFTAAVFQHQTALACATLPLAGCLLAFGIYLTSAQDNFTGQYSYSDFRNWSLNASVYAASMRSLGQDIGRYNSLGGGAGLTHSIGSRNLYFTLRADDRQYKVGTAFSRNYYTASVGVAYSPGDVPLRLW